MHAFLITGDPSEYINNLDGKVIEFPFAKISDVRDLNDFTKLKLNQKTNIVLRNFDRASEEAQSAFLKSLEEPQENLVYVLTADTLFSILPTIVSRCELKEIGNSKTKDLSYEGEKIKSFMEAEIGEKISFVSKISKREEAIGFLTSLIFFEHGKFLKDSNYVGLLEIANETLRNLEVNGNVQLQLTNFLVNLSS